MHDDADTDVAGTVFRDVILLALLGFVAITLLLLPHINPKGRDAAAAVLPPGNVIVEVTWPDDLDTDVDLWVRAPGDRPVGYSNKGGQVFNLLRDDLGKMNDPTEINHEIAYARGMAPGEYVVNLHLYRNSARTLPVPVKVVVSATHAGNASVRHLLEQRVDLSHEGEEVTVFRFELNKAGDVVPESVHDLFVALRSPGK